MVHYNILTLSPYTLFLSPHPSPTPSFIASPSSPYSFLHCFIAFPPLLLPSLPHPSPPTLFFIASLPHPSPTPSFIASPSSPLLLPSLPHPPPLLLSSLPQCLTLPLLFPSLPHPPPPIPFFIASPSSTTPSFITSPSPYSFLHCLTLLLSSLLH